MIRILLVDDQNLVHQGLKLLLDRDPEIEVVGTVEDGRSAVIQINELRPDIVLLDIEMPEMDGITATKYITRLAPQTKVIILSSHEDKKYLTQALMAGAKAYVLKSSMMSELKQSIMAVNSGYSHIESRLLAKVFDPSNLKRSNSQKTPTQHPQSSPQKYRSSTTQTKEGVHESTLSTPMFAERSMQAAGDVGSLPTSKAVPKINLPYSDLDLVNHSNPTAKSDSETVEPMPASIETNKQLLPSKVVQSSALQLPTTAKNQSHKTFMVTVNGKRYVQKIVERPAVAKYKAKLERFWTEKTLHYKPLFDHYGFQLAEYRTRMMPIFRKWHEKGWLANIGLVCLGLFMVIIIHSVFS